MKSVRRIFIFDSIFILSLRGYLRICALSTKGKKQKAEGRKQKAASIRLLSEELLVKLLVYQPLTDCLLPTAYCLLPSALLLDSLRKASLSSQARRVCCLGVTSICESNQTEAVSCD